MEIKILHERCTLCGRCRDVCPFAAVALDQGYVDINANCRLCRICIRECPEDALILQRNAADLGGMRQGEGLMIVAEFEAGRLHPISLELLGKANELAATLGQSVTAVLIGFQTEAAAEVLLAHGAQQVWCYDHAEFEYFRIEPYTNAVSDAVDALRPEILLLGATVSGRSLAPRLAVRFRTGLTADCTVLDVKSGGELMQIRPAFGGNIMAEIATPHQRPQMATVRQKVMPAANPGRQPDAAVIRRQLNGAELRSGIRVLKSTEIPESASISDAEVVVAAGRGFKSPADLQLAYSLAERLGGQVGVSRPLVEMGWADHRQQIGLSGRGIRPRLLITLGISGAVQFSAAIAGAECIMAINQDPAAAIFAHAHYAVVGDMYAVLPNLLAQIQKGAWSHAVR